MSVEKIVYFISHYNESIINWLVVAILITVILYIYLSFSKKPETDKNQATEKALEGLEETLKRVMSQLGPQAMSGGGSFSQGENAAAGDGSVSMTDANGNPVVGEGGSSNGGQNSQASQGGAQASGAGASELALELQKREAEIKALKDEVANAKPSTDPAQFIAKIRELEEKLAEYEIIEDDIADLSMYKDENATLKAELDRLKAGGAAPTANTAVTEVAAPETPKAEAPAQEIAEEALTPEAEEEPQEDLVGEFKQAVKEGDEIIEAQAKLNEADSEKVTSPQAASLSSDETARQEVAPSDDIMAEFSATGEGKGEDDDLIAEFAQALSNDSAAANKDPLAPLMTEDEAAQVEDADGVDTSKMLEEMSELSATTPVDGENALEEDLDVDKMAQEATKLGE